MTLKNTTFKWSRNWFNNYYHEDIYGYVFARFIPIVTKYISQSKGTILDAACGFGNQYIKKLGLTNTIGMDIDPLVKDKNQLHKEFIIGDLHELKAKQEFNCIISLNTWEHLHSPQIVMKNFYNALSDNGILVIIAPQRWHHIAIFESLLPSYFKNMAWRILKNHNHMPYNTFYKLCSRKKLISEAVRQGFTVEHFSSIEGPPLWFTKIPPLFITACFWMSLVNKYSIFRNIRGSFIAVLKKT